MPYLFEHNTVQQKKKVSPTLTTVGDSRVIWRTKNDAVFIYFSSSSKFGFFGPITASSVEKLRKIQIEFKKCFAQKCFSLIPSE